MWGLVTAAPYLHLHTFSFICQVGQVLLSRFDGSAAVLVEEAKGSALSLLNLVTSHFPGFRDHAVYTGRQVCDVHSYVMVTFVCASMRRLHSLCTGCKACFRTPFHWWCLALAYGLRMPDRTSNNPSTQPKTEAPAEYFFTTPNQPPRPSKPTTPHHPHAGVPLQARPDLLW